MAKYKPGDKFVIEVEEVFDWEVPSECGTKERTCYRLKGHSVLITETELEQFKKIQE